MWRVCSENESKLLDQACLFEFVSALLAGHQHVMFIANRKSRDNIVNVISNGDSERAREALSSSQEIVRVRVRGDYEKE